MSELPWGNKKEKEQTSPFGTEATADAPFLANTTVTPIGDPKNKDPGTVADSTIHINPVDQHDLKPEVSIIDGIENRSLDSVNIDTPLFINDEREDEDLKKAINIQENTAEGPINGITATANEEITPEKGTGSRKRSLPLFEPEFPAEDDNSCPVLPYADQVSIDTDSNKPPQELEREPFEAIPKNTTYDPFKPPEPRTQSHTNTERNSVSGTPLFPPATPDMSSNLENVSQESEDKVNKNEKGILALITNTFKRFTHKRKLLDRMEEWQPPASEVKIEEDVTEPVKINVDLTSGKKGSLPYENINTPTLEEIRTVIPIDPQNIENAPEWKPPGIQFDKLSLEGTTEVGETEHTNAPIGPDNDLNIGYSSKEIQKIKDELAYSKQGNGDLSKDIKNISGTINTLESSINSIKRDGDKSSSIINMRVDESAEQIEFLEERLNEFEITLESIHTDNVELKTGLNTIEQNIVELTGSYGIMLKQMQKLTEFGNSRSAEIFETNNRIDELDQTLTTMNTIQVESQKRMLELHSVTSDLIRSVENTHNANKELRTDSEAQDQLLKDELLSLTDFVEKEFKNLGARSYRANGENVQLNNIIKNSTNMKLCMEWLEFLMELVGCNHLVDILSYYEELGWISEDIRLELMRYAEGIDYYIEKSDWKLAPDDHVKSIWFIEQLAGLKVDKNRLSIIEKNIKKVKKGTEIYGI
ncbi:flagella protein [Methanococcoides vulcani]|uniref:Flagella protein n=1 Tax=Methanococcoides vulcani TaxID=1353158 RepID=A0A1H9YCN5_9EURY|nr:FlaD/FlaE family flagellar protein [Methanococcoides vulcani]SES66673.1 flagella protein [Methanococcoides vulcani]